MKASFPILALKVGNDWCWTDLSRGLLNGAFQCAWWGLDMDDFPPYRHRTVFLESPDEIVFLGWTRGENEEKS